LLEVLANQFLSLWPIPAGATARLINVPKNTTYLVEAPGRLNQRFMVLFAFVEGAQPDTTGDLVTPLSL